MIILSDEIAERIKDELGLCLGSAGERGHALLCELRPHLDASRSTNAPGYGNCSRCTSFDVHSNAEPCRSCSSRCTVFANWTPGNGGDDE